MAHPGTEHQYLTVDQIKEVIAGCDSRILGERAMKAEFEALLAAASAKTRQRLYDLEGRTRLLAAILRGEGREHQLPDAEILQQVTTELRQMLTIAMEGIGQ